jgi:hypothetical protein
MTGWGPWKTVGGLGVMQLTMVALPPLGAVPLLSVTLRHAMVQGSGTQVVQLSVVTVPLSSVTGQVTLMVWKQPVPPAPIATVTAAAFEGACGCGTRSAS